MRKKDYLFFTCGILMLLSEIWKQCCLTFIVNHGVYDWWYFPFQLCSIPMYICLLLPFTKTEALHRAMYTFLMDFGLLGGIFVFFDTSGMHYGYAPLTVHSYLWHILLIFIGIMAGLRNHYKCWTDYKNSTYIYLTCCGLATLFNECFFSRGAINMFFISPNYHMSQIVFTRFADVLGNRAGILLYIGATIAGAGIFHYIWEQIDGLYRSSCR